MADIHPNFKAGHANMLKIASTKEGKKIYGQAVGKAKSSHEKALNKKAIPKHYRGNTNSEGGIPFGRKPKD